MSRKTRKNRSQRSNCSIEPLENRQLMASDILLAAGDANSDGFFDASDFLQVFQRGKFLTAQQADWSQGDWNGDSQFDHSDLIVALQSGNYNNGPIAPNIQFDRSTEQLHIEGTLRSDAVDVSFFGDDFVAINLEIENDRPQSLVVRRTELAEIIFDGKAGNDHFVNRTDIRSISQGGEGDDVFTGGDANDSFAGGSGNDVLIGGKGVDVLFGNSGNDRIYGGLGGDLLDGGEGNDELYGEEDDDILIGGSDNDKFAGGPGSDFGVLGTSDTVDLENHTSLSSNSLVQQTSFAGFQLGESADAASEDEQNPLISTDPGLPCPSGNVCFDIPMFMLSQSDSRQGEDKEAKEPENVSGTLLIDPTRAYPIDFDFDPVGDIAIRGEDDDREMHITDVVQQRLGNCYFAAVLSSLTTTSFVLENKIRYVGQVDGGHEYAVKIFDVNVTDGGHITSVGEWTSVKLNYNKNANDNGYRRAEVLTDSENELWSVLYQLAYANKLQAENLNTNGGTAAAAFAAITGRTGMSLNVAESQYAIWWALNRGDIVYVGSPNSIGANGENQDLSNSTTDGGADRFHDGIVLNHGYSIVDLSGTGDEAVITLRNPWGNDNEYAKEMWSIMDQGTPNPNDGFISMSWGQFVRRFSIPKSSNVFIGLLQPRPSDAASSEYLTYGYLKQAALFSTGNTGEVIEDHVNWASRNWNEVEAKAAIVKHMQTIQDEGWRNLPDVYALVKNAVNMSQGNLADQHSIHRDWANSQHPGTVVDGIERELIKINDRYDLGLNVSNDRLQDHIVAAQVYGHLKQASKFAEGFRDEKIEDHTAWAMKYWAVAETRSGMVRHMENILNNGWQNLNEVFGHMKNAGLLANGKAIEPFAGHVHWANGQRVAVVGNGIEHHVNAIKNAFNLNLQSPIQAELPTERAMAEAFGHIKNAGLLSLSKGIENQQGHVSWALRQSQSAVAEAISGHMSNILRDGWRKLNRVYSYITNAQLVAEGKSAQPLPNLRNDAASKGAIALGDLIESRISSLRQIYGLDGGENDSMRIPGDLVDKVGKIGLDGWRGSPYNVDAVVRHPNGKAYFFRGDQYYRFDFSSDRRDKIGTIGSHGWKGVPTHLDAAILHPNGKAYFFKGSKYYRFNFKTEKVDKEGTIDVHGWKGVPRDVDATVMHPNGKAYFFKGNQYYRFDFRSDRVDKVSTIGSGGWSRLPANVDAAILHPNGKAYFFRGQQYHRFVF